MLAACLEAVGHVTRLPVVSRVVCQLMNLLDLLLLLPPLFAASSELALFVCLASRLG
jgi:hypothetical protein